MKSYNNKVCIVTGAASGLGLEISRQLLKSGAKVCLADIDKTGLEEAQTDLSEFKGQHKTFVVDVTEIQQIQKLVNSVVCWAGTVDFMFNNAGIGGSLPINKASTEHWARILDLNLWSVINGIETILPVMLKNGSGHIVNTSSISGLLPVPGQALYNTTKYAVVGLSESLRIELASKGINVSVICPGPFASKIWGKPIIGDSVDVPSPQHAASVEEVARDALKLVSENTGIIVLPRSEKRSWNVYRWVPSIVEKSLSKLV